MHRREAVRILGALVGSTPLGASWNYAFAKCEESPPMLKLLIERKEVTPACMRGYLLTQIGDAEPEVACYVLELPPKDNAPYVSAIPAGAYRVQVRREGKRGWRLELRNVPGRDNVQIHVGNYPKDTVGCVLPGLRAAAGQCSVSDSAGAMKKLKDLFMVFGENAATELTLVDP